MNVKAFFVDALTAALDLELATHDDVLRHVTPDVLAVNLPRPLWARLLAACLGAPRADARLVVETIGIANLCEHIPTPIIWTCIAEIGARSLGKTLDVPTGALQTTASGRAIIPPPPDPTAPLAAGTGVPGLPGAMTAAPPPGPGTASLGPSIPPPAPTVSDVIADLEQTDDAPARPSRTSTATRFRQSSTSVGRGLGSGARRPQVSAPSPTPVSPTAFSRTPRRTTDIEQEPQTNVQDAWGDKEIAVDDSQLVDWQTDVGASSAITGDDDFSDLGGRKR